MLPECQVPFAVNVLLQLCWCHIFVSCNDNVAQRCFIQLSIPQSFFSHSLQFICCQIAKFLLHLLCYYKLQLCWCHVFVSCNVNVAQRCFIQLSIPQSFFSHSLQFICCQIAKFLLHLLCYYKLQLCWCHVFVSCNVNVAQRWLILFSIAQSFFPTLFNLFICCQNAK